MPQEPAAKKRYDQLKQLSDDDIIRIAKQHYRVVNITDRTELINGIMESEFGKDWKQQLNKKESFPEFIKKLKEYAPDEYLENQGEYYTRQLINLTNNLQDGLQRLSKQYRDVLEYEQMNDVKQTINDKEEDLTKSIEQLNSEISKKIEDAKNKVKK